MSASVGLTTSVTRPALFPFVAANTSQTRSIWRYARNSQANEDKTGPVSRRIDKYHRHPLVNTRSKAEARDWPSTTHRQSTGGWALWRSRSGFSDLSLGREQTSYCAIASNNSFKPDGTWPGSLPSFLKIDYSANRQRANLYSKAHLQDFNFAQLPHYSHFKGLQYDPISGRMVPEAPQPGAGNHDSKQSHKPVIDCPPGSEVEANLVSTTTSVEDGKSHPGLSKAARLLNSQFTPKSQSKDCSPGSELESIFAANPATSQEARASQESTNKPKIHITCPPGNELEALLTSEAIPSKEPHAEVYKVPGSTKSRDADAGLGSSGNVKRSPGSVSKKSQQPKTTDAVDYAPGSEPEPVLMTDPATAVDTHPKPTAAGEPINPRKANITIDCPPGNELEARMISDAATDGKFEDLGTLQACDIRARYAPKPRPAQDLSFDGSEDVGDLLSQSQEVSTEKVVSAAYHILAYDSSESQVTSTEAQSFFGDNDTAQPHEILARLHNPAKFVPYFAQLQQEGFKIATGGGDILVFKRAINQPKQAVSQSALEQDTEVHTRISQCLRHEPYQPSNSGSSFKVSRQ